MSTDIEVVEADTPDVVVVEGDTTVVVEESSDDATPTELEHEGRLVALEMTVSAMSEVILQHTSAIENLSYVDQAQDEAINEIVGHEVMEEQQEAVEEQQEAQEEAQEEAAADEAPISKLHRWWNGKQK